MQSDFVLVSSFKISLDFGHDFVWTKAEVGSLQILVHAACVYSGGKKRWNCVLPCFPDTAYYDTLAASLVFLSVQ